MIAEVKMWKITNERPGEIDYEIQTSRNPENLETGTFFGTREKCEIYLMELQKCRERREEALKYDTYRVRQAKKQIINSRRGPSI